VYSDRLFLKTLVIMIARHLHKVYELLMVLAQPTPELEQLLGPGGSIGGTGEPLGGVTPPGAPRGSGPPADDIETPGGGGQLGAAVDAEFGLRQVHFLTFGKFVLCFLGGWGTKTHFRFSFFIRMGTEIPSPSVRRCKVKPGFYLGANSTMCDLPSISLASFSTGPNFITCAWCGAHWLADKSYFLACGSRLRSR
jgi:hypothetical protein